jgi:hypothetical protein
MKSICTISVALAIANLPAFAVESDVVAVNVKSTELMVIPTGGWNAGDFKVQLGQPFSLPAGIYCNGNVDTFVLKAYDDSGGRARSLIQRAMASRQMIGLRIFQNASGPCTVMAAGIIQ